MADLEVQPSWPKVREIGIELARGGPNGNMNEQAKALVARTELLMEQKASKSEIVQGVFEFNTYAEFNAAKSTLPLNCTVVIGEENTTGTGTWGIGNNRWSGSVLSKSSFDPVEKSNRFTKSKLGKSIKPITQDTPTLNYYIQRDGWTGAMAGYQQTKFKITAGKKYRLTGTITSPPLPSPAWTTFGLYMQSKASSISEANRLIDTLVTASASTVQGSTMHNIDIDIEAVAEAQYLIVSQKSTDSLSLYEYYELEPRLNNIDAQLPQIGTNNNRLGVIETDIKNKAAVLSPYVTNGQYLNYVGTANVNTDYELHRYDVLEGDFIFIDGQFTAPLSPSSTKTIGYCGFYTTTSMGSLIAGSLTQQAENSTKSYAVSYIVPPGAKYLNISVKRGTDVTVVKRSPNMASIANRFPNVITLWGDSITWGSAPEDGVTWAQRLQTRIGKRATVLNCGIGGDSIWQISARSGAIPFVNTVDFVLPALASETVQVGSMVNYSYNNFFKSSYDLTKNVYLLIQGETGRYEKIKTINPVYVDGIECTLSINKISDGNYDWFLKRNVDAVAPRTIYAHTPFYTNGARNIKSTASVFWMGTNESFTGGVMDVDAYINVLKRNIQYQGVSRYVVIGVYGGTGISGMSVAQLEAMEERMLKEFGSHYINMRKYVTTNALSDAGITPTSADTAAKAQGKCPPSLTADGLHPNAAFCDLIYKKVYECLEMQGGIYVT
jgi:hypothetical protein